MKTSVVDSGRAKIKAKKADTPNILQFFRWLKPYLMIDISSRNWRGISSVRGPTYTLLVVICCIVIIISIGMANTDSRTAHEALMTDYSTQIQDCKQHYTIKECIGALHIYMDNNSRLELCKSMIYDSREAVCYVILAQNMPKEFLD